MTEDTKQKNYFKSFVYEFPEFFFPENFSVPQKNVLN